jgi:cysteinyl-tRNA synthetase
MIVRLFDTLSKEVTTLQTLEPGRVKMYCCGITPYSNTHIGHTRTFFSYDLLYRVLVDAGYHVDWARNITDVEDKIIAKALAEGVTPGDIVRRYVTEQTEVFDKFRLKVPDEPRVTETIPEILEMIGTLIKKDHAYVSSSGVYFRVHRFGDYGKLSRNKVAELRKGARVEVDESKEDAVDFVLWKFAKPGEPAEVIWPSPWGAGRPGWHIECSAMIHKKFGDTIDIHMGGRDLIFPHHECEIAQSEAATGKTFSSIWLHCGMVTLYGEKMSKSTNHFVSIADFLKRYPDEVLRLVFLSTSYSQPLDYTDELATENYKKLAKIYRAVALFDSYAQAKPTGPDTSSATGTGASAIFVGMDELCQAMRSHLREDLGSAAALGVFFDFVRQANQALAALEKRGQTLSAADQEALKDQWPRFKAWMSETLGLLGSTPQEFFALAAALRRDEGDHLDDTRVEHLIAQRNSARAAKDWAAADRVRDELLNHGIQVQDTPSGTKWTVDI